MSASGRPGDQGDRHAYGLDWQMELPDGGNVLGDEVTLTVHLELVTEA